MEFTFEEDEKILLGQLSAVADEMKLDAYIVGGFIRDRLLLRDSKDIDVVCVGSGIELAETFAKALDPSPQVVVYKNFGTAMLKYDGWEFEFVGARKESYRYDSRKPIVEEGSIEDDQKRRDFTINALAVSINEENFGRLVDPFGGIQDLKNRTIKTPLEPDTTFSDDPLRMLRAIRFASQLQFEIEPKTLDSIKRNASRLDIISKERIHTEFNKILLSPVPSVGLILLEETNLLPFIMPELQELKGVDTRNGISHKDNFYHTAEVVDNVALMSTDLWLRYAALLHDIGKPPTKRFQEGVGWTFHGHEVVGARMVKKIFKKLKLPLDAKMKFVQKLVLLHLRPISLTKENITDSAIRRLLFDADDDLEKLMILCKADITSKNEQKKKRYRENYDVVMQKLEEVEEKDKIRNWQPPISGQVIMDYFNIPPSKEVGEIKDAIREAILEGDLENNYDAAFQFMIDKGNQILQ